MKTQLNGTENNDSLNKRLQTAIMTNESIKTAAINNIAILQDMENLITILREDIEQYEQPEWNSDDISKFTNSIEKLAIQTDETLLAINNLLETLDNLKNKRTFEEKNEY